MFDKRADPRVLKLSMLDRAKGTLAGAHVLSLEIVARQP
jgi:hypothetical protein